MTTSPARRARRLRLGRAVRGAGTGLAVCAAFSLAFAYARQDVLARVGQRPETDGLAVLGAIAGTGLAIGVPLGYLTGVLVAWAAGLRRPWAVSLLGLLAGSLIVCAAGVLTQGGPPVSGWLSIVVVTGTYTGAAVVLPRDHPAP